MLPIQVALLCLAVAAGEMLNGIVRAVFVGPRLGQAAAKRVMLPVALVVALLIACVFVAWIGPQDAAVWWTIGGVLAAFMVTFDLAVGRGLMRLPWPAIAADFDLRRGNLVLIGVAAMVGVPRLAAWLVG